MSKWLRTATVDGVGCDARSLARRTVADDRADVARTMNENDRRRDVEMERRMNAAAPPPRHDEARPAVCARPPRARVAAGTALRAARKREDGRHDLAPRVGVHARAHPRRRRGLRAIGEERPRGRRAALSRPRARADAARRATTGVQPHPGVQAVRAGSRLGASRAADPACRRSRTRRSSARR
jgi:hypothetical protein